MLLLDTDCVSHRRGGTGRLPPALATKKEPDTRKGRLVGWCCGVSGCSLGLNGVEGGGTGAAGGAVVGAGKQGMGVKRQLWWGGSACSSRAVLKLQTQAKCVGVLLYYL